jgi:hypothetical protein
MHRHLKLNELSGQYKINAVHPLLTQFSYTIYGTKTICLKSPKNAANTEVGKVSISYFEMETKMINK